MTTANHIDGKKSYARLAEKSDLDGTREAGLMFWIALFGGVMLSATVHPLALTSFWVWVGLLAMAIAAAVHTQRFVAWWFGVDSTDEGK